MSEFLCLLVSCLHSANTFFYLLHLSACTYWTLSKWMCRAHLWIAGQSLSAAPLYPNIVLPVLIWQPSAASGCRVADIPKRASPTFMPCGSICPLPPPLFYLLMVILHVVGSPCYLFNLFNCTALLNNLLNLTATKNCQHSCLELSAFTGCNSRSNMCWSVLVRENVAWFGNAAFCSQPATSHFQPKALTQMLAYSWNRQFANLMACVCV